MYMDTAKIFDSGNSQAVRLPKEYRFTGTEVGIQRVGNTTVLFPLDRAWQTFLDGLDGFSNDFMVDGRVADVPQVRDSL